MNHYAPTMTHPTAHEPALRAEIKAAIKRAGVSREELSRRTGLSIRSLRRHLDGEGGFSVSALLAIAKAVDTDAFALLERVRAGH